jgi:hypothetical protein
MRLTAEAGCDGGLSPVGIPTSHQPDAPSLGGPGSVQKHKGNRGSDPRLLGLTTGTLLARTLGSDPVEQGSRLPEGQTSPQTKTSYWRPQWASRRVEPTHVVDDTPPAESAHPSITVVVLL